MYLPLTSKLARIRYGCVGAYPLNDPSSATIYTDVSGCGNHGSASGAFSQTDGPFGACVNTNVAAHTGITIPYSAQYHYCADERQPFTVTGYAKVVSNFGNFPTLLSQWSTSAATASWTTRLSSTGQLYFQISDGTTRITYSSTEVLGTGSEWHFLAYRFRRAGPIIMYGDGTNNASYNTLENTATGFNASTLNLKIARDENGSQLRGAVACVGVWRRFLTDQEIEAVRFWPMN